MKLEKCNALRILERSLVSLVLFLAGPDGVTYET